MMRSMYSGVAGLKTHQTRMDVIGNNIANVNTVGYKSQTVTFSELLYQTTSTASGPNAETGIGGTNAKQVGLGVKTGAISTNIDQAGSAETTNNPFDICITGSSFFVVSNGSDKLFTRDGSFSVDGAGNLVMSSTGYNVMGWQYDESTGSIKQDTVSALRIMSAANMTYPPEATTEAYLSGIVDKNSKEVTSDEGRIMNLNFYDNRGYSYTAKLSMKQIADDTDGNPVYSCELVSLVDSDNEEVNAGAALGASQTMRFADNEVKNFDVASGYNMRKVGTDYVITTAEEDGKYTAYSIHNDGTVGAHDYVSPLPAAPADPRVQAQETGTAYSDEAAQEGIAQAFGCDSYKELQTYLLEVAYNDGTTPTTQYQLSSPAQIYNYLEAKETAEAAGTLDEDATGLAGITTSAVTITFSKKDGSFIGVNGVAGSKSASITFDPEATNFDTINVDFSSLSNVNNEGVSTAAATNGSTSNKGGGRKLGEMTGVSIQNNGMIYATYDNGQSKLLGQIAVASFANAGGLQKEGDNLYKATQNSGDFDGIGVDITSDGGYMTTGELEMSNVDLSGELTSMIVTQRGFQANSRIITVSDTMLEELVNLKR